MSTLYSFQEQLVSIMDALSKTAVSEISKLVDIESKVLKLEITRGRNEIAVLSEKLQLMESLLWVDRGHIDDGKADKHSKTPTRAMNDSFGRPPSLPTRPGIKSERSCEHICSPQEMPGVQQVDDSSPALETLPTTTSRGQSELIVIKEEPSGMEIWNNGPKTDEKGATTPQETEAGHLDVLQHCPDDSDNQNTLSESEVEHEAPYPKDLRG
ncbi:hypothetical protein UPYG_G00096130 [Umbra pygmaea]|uniref:Uncharacterized protein n=1 Tax=Umbra pygmaea TaxID=75934 RepID=A0ABD0X3U8_UMBPY